MYNIYTEEKKIFERNKKLKNEKDMQECNEKHKLKTNTLFNNYQKRIKKFIIDVRNVYIINIKINFYRWLKKIHI